MLIRFLNDTVAVYLFVDKYRNKLKKNPNFFINFSSLKLKQLEHTKQIWITLVTHYSLDIFHQNSSRLLLESRSCVRDVSTSSLGLLPSCLPPLLLTFTVPLSLSLSPTTGQKQQNT